MKIQKILTIGIIGAISTITLKTNAQNISGKIIDHSGEKIIGAVIRWEGTNTAVASDNNGQYSIKKIEGAKNIIASFAGYQNDTITVDQSTNILNIILKNKSHEIESVKVKGQQSGNFIQTSGIKKTEVISYAGLCKMACCNLAESFENSAAVTVGYSDAISGARQIRMLGLAGIYTQMLDENRVIMRGLSSPYALNYTPGMWLNSIQVSKGISSVSSGHEAITGQINLEHRKPTDSEKMFLNLFLNSELRPEINVSTALPVNKSGTLSTIVLAHVSGETDIIEMDHNDDGFRDMPSGQFYTVANRWNYLDPNGFQLRWGFKLLSDRRLGGDVNFEPSMRPDMLNDNIYGSLIKNLGGNGYFKFGMPVGKGIIDTLSGEELRSNVAVVVDFDYFKQDTYMGLNNYYGAQNSTLATAMYNHYFSTSSSLILGASTQINQFTETLGNETPWLNSSHSYDLSRQENEFGIYGEYTFNHKDIISLIAGVRADYNQYFDKFFLTPRGQVKWSITPTSTLRGSVGMGYRTANVVTDNIWILATGRQVVFDQGTNNDFDRLESALTYGASFTQQFGILQPGDATVSLDYFRTGFFNQVVIDQEMDPQNIHIYSTNEQSYTNSYQVDFMWKPSERFDVFATFRYTDSKITLNRADGSTYKINRPLISQYKTLINLQYATNMRRWVFDVTAQLNGPSRLPVQNGNITQEEYSPIYPMFFAQVSRRIGSWEIYLGCENIANYRQETPIINADDPFSTAFNSSVVWGSLSGRKFYLGARFNLY